MLKLFIVIALFLSCHAFPNDSTDAEPDNNKSYDLFSKHFLAELEHIRRYYKDSLPSPEDIEIHKHLMPDDDVWQRSAQEFNVTVEQLKSIWDYSSKLRKLEDERNSKTAEYTKETCKRYYVPAEIEDKPEDTTVSTNDLSGLLEVLANPFLKAIQMAAALSFETLAFVNATTTVEQLKSFENMCKLLHEIGDDSPKFPEPNYEVV